MKFALFVLLIAFAGSYSAAGVPATLPSAEDGQIEFERMSRLIRAMGAARDLEGLRSLAERIQAEWADRSAGAYGQLMFEVVGELSSRQFDDPRQYELMWQWGVRAMERAEQMPLALQADLVRFVQADPKASADAWPQRRGQTIALKFQVWKRIHDAVDQAWDADRDYPRGVPLPPGVGSRAGITDPKQRQEYDAAVAQYRQQAARWSLQRDLRNLEPQIAQDTERAAIWAYSQQPPALGELRSLLGQYVADEAARARILKEAQAHLQPADGARRAPPQPPLEERLRQRRLEGAAP
jgi:hypothetical protein